MMGGPDGELDVDSLFDDESADKAPEDAAHAAVTMRPRAFKKEEPSGLRAPPEAYRSDFMAAVVVLDPAPVTSGTSGTSVVTRADVTMAALRGEAGVLGVVVREANGHLSTAGNVDARLEERAAYLGRLAAMVGEELGLDTLRELHVGGAENRLAWISSTDGSTATILAQSNADMTLVARKVPR